MSIASLLVAAGNQPNGSFPPASPRRVIFFKEPYGKYILIVHFRIELVDFRESRAFTPLLELSFKTKGAVFFIILGWNHSCCNLFLSLCRGDTALHTAHDGFLAFKHFCALI